MSGGALAGLRVIDAASLYAAPFVSTLLADQGADVIKIEPPGGDPFRTYPTRMWPLLARGKHSVELDLRDPEGCKRLREMVVEADALVINLLPRTLLARGLDYATLSSRNADLIMVSMTGFGLDGPYADRPGNGTIGEAYAGLTHMTGDPAGAPVLSSVALGDAVTGYVGAFGVLAACYHKLAHDGPGQLIDLNTVDAMLQVTGPVLAEYADGAEPAMRLNSRLSGPVLRNVFRAADGRWIAVSASTSRQTAELAELAGLDGDDPEAHTLDAMESALRRWTAARPSADIIAELVARRLPVAPVQSARDVLEDPHLVARGAVIKIHTEEHGDVYSPAPAPRLLGTPAPRHDRTPEAGEHNAKVLGGSDSGEA